MARQGEHGAEGPMAIMGPGEEAKAAYELLGALKGLQATAMFCRGAESAILVKMCEQRLWSKLDYPSQAAFLESRRVSPGEYRERRQELDAFGEGLMNRLDEAGVPRKVRRLLVHVDKKNLIELKAAIAKEHDPESMKELVEAFYNAAAETEIAKRQAEENYKNAKASLEEERSAKKDAEKKLHAAEKSLAQKDKFYGADPDRSVLAQRVLEVLAQYQRFVRATGIKTEDAKHFKRSLDEMRNAIDNVWRDFIAPPDGTISREDYKRILMKEKGIGEDQAEDIISESGLE